MSKNQLSINVQSPLEIPIESVEKELSSFWRNAASQQGTMVRACSCNLIAVARDKREADALFSVMALVAERYPCRSIIAYREKEHDRTACSDQPHMHAWISAHCTLPFSSGPQVCTEIIAVAAYGEASSNLHNTVASLLVSDLPVFVYWRSFGADEQTLIENLARFSHVLIVDSHVLKDDVHNRDRLFELLNRPPAGIAVRDLNWARLTAWRDFIAQFFDSPSARPLLHEISEVEIRRAVVPGSIPTRTLLLTGWLASRLGWKRTSAQRHGDEWVSRWSSSGGEVVVRFIPESFASEQEAGINTVSLRTRSGPTLAVTRQGTSSMTASASQNDRHTVHSVPQDEMDERSLLVQELSLSGEDSMFKEALAAALALEKSFEK